MTLKERLPLLMSELLTCSDSDALFNLLGQGTDDLGFPVVTYLQIPPIGLRDIGIPIVNYSKGFPQEMRQRYVDEKLYLVDPLRKRAMRTGEVFWWLDPDGLSGARGDVKKIIKVIRDTSVGDGYSIPVFGPASRNGYFGIGRGTFARTDCKEEGKLLQLFCQALHLRYCLLTRAERDKTKLSTKEKQVMSFVVHGLSTAEIAGEMDLSINTINTHLKNVYVKMKVSDRVSATLRFLGHGYNYD